MSGPTISDMTLLRTIVTGGRKDPMTCVTCNGPAALPPEHTLSGVMRPAMVRVDGIGDHEPVYLAGEPITGGRFDPRGHLSARLGDPIAPGAIAVLFRDLDWTAQCVEALAGPESHGWVEIRKMTGSGTYAIHPETRMCGGCGADWEPNFGETGAACSSCESTDSRIKTPAHAQTLIRRGMVTIIRGAELITHTEREPARRGDLFAPDASPDDRVRQAIETAEAAGAAFPQPGDQPAPDVTPADVAAATHFMGLTLDADEAAAVSQFLANRRVKEHADD